MPDPRQSRDPDRIPGLDALATHGERLTDPPPVEQVRARGDRRRRRRHTAVGAGALVVVLLAGGVLAGGSSLLETTQIPDPAKSPTISAAPTRTVGPENLVPADEVPLDERTEQVEPADGTRGPDDLSVCQPAPLTELGPTSVAWSAYALIPTGGFSDDHPLADQPNLFLAALQFDTEAAAAEALQTYRGWLDDCPEHLQAEGYQPKGDDDGEGLRPITWYEVEVEGAEAGFAEQIYWLPDESEMGDGYFEGVALAVSGDRLLVAVHLTYGPEHYWSTPNETDPSGAGPHPLEQLLPVAVEYLDAE